MNELEKLYNGIDKTKFISNAHTKQNRMFGFVTTNLRNVGSFVRYIKDLVPVYQSFKNEDDIKGWTKYCIDNQYRDKQKYTRLEMAKIIFRNVEYNIHLNDNAEKLFKIFQTDNKYLELFLSLYLLSGRYFDVERQPIVEIEKIQASYKGNLLDDCLDVLQNNNLNRIFFATFFFYDDFEDILHYLLENDTLDIHYFNSIIDKDDFFIKKICDANHFKKYNLKNFKYDVFLIANYLIFRDACETNKNAFILGRPQGIKKIVEDYLKYFYEYKLNKFLRIKDDLFTNSKNHLKGIFITNYKLLDNVINHILNFQEDDWQLSNKEKKTNLLKKYDYKCFMDYCGYDSEVHSKIYFNTQKGELYLEDHHIIQRENLKLMKKSPDEMENIIPLCPNCHRKIHNAEKTEVVKMLKTIYKNIDKEKLKDCGLYVDLNTLGSFYGIEEDIE